MAANLPDLELLATFLEIHRAGSITAAAARRGLTQPAVSGQLARLEKEVGAPLFVRGGRGSLPPAVPTSSPAGSERTSTSSGPRSTRSPRSRARCGSGERPSS